MPGQLFRGAFGDDVAAARAALGAEVYDPVRGFDHVQVMLDDHDGIAVIAQPMQDFEQLLNIVEMQAGRGFVEDIQGLAGVALGQFPGEFDPLRLAAGQGGRVLAELDIGQAHVHQCLQLARDDRDRREEFVRLFHAEPQSLVDVFALVADVQRLPVVAPPVADVARHIDIRQEVHLDLDQTVALAGLAAPARARIHRRRGSRGRG